MGTFTRLLSYIVPYWYLAALSLTIASIVAYLGALEPIFTQQIIDFVIVGQQYEKLNLLLLSLIVTVVGIGILNYLDHYFQSYIAQKVMANVRRYLLASLQKKPFEFYDKNKVGQLVSTMTVDVEAIGRMLGTWLEHIVSMILIIAMAFIIMININPTMALIAIAPMPIIFFFTLRFGSKMVPLMKEQQQILGEVGVVVQQNIFGMKVVRTFEGEEREVQNFKDVEGKYLRNGILSGKLRAQNMPLGSFVLSLGVSFVYLYGASLILSPIPVLTIGQLYLFTRYMMRLSQPLMFLSMMVTLSTNAKAGAERVFAIIDEEPGIQEKKDAITMPALKGEVKFENIQFEYLPGKPVLENINFTAQPGEIIAILGATGSGKSTLIYLIPRFYDVTKGKILIDGMDVRDVTLQSLRRQVGLVQQDIFLFTGTIRDNIAFGKSDATQEEVEVAAKLAKAHDFIISFPEGYNTMVGERGVTLSGGQKQRMSIARTLITNPKILILDDSLSFVDARTEQEIQDALKVIMKGRTTFVIAQRLSTIKNAHRIMVLENGRIIEIGTHEELVALDGIYKRIYETQFESLSEPLKEISKIQIKDYHSEEN